MTWQASWTIVLYITWSMFGIVGFIAFVYGCMFALALHEGEKRLRRQAAIPADERCLLCRGLGYTVEPDHDARCPRCGGQGRRNHFA